MNESIIYLKKEYYGLRVVAYNPKNLTRVCVCDAKESSIERYNDQSELDWNVNYEISEMGSVLSDRETFNKAFIAFTTNLNELSKEL